MDTNNVIFHIQGFSQRMRLQMRSVSFNPCLPAS